VLFVMGLGMGVMMMLIMILVLKMLIYYDVVCGLILLNII